MNGDPLGGRYHLVEQIGAGGMAVVWRAHDQVLARSVAVKLLAKRQTNDAEARERIRQEARAAAALSHPNIAQVHDYGEWQSGYDIIPYVVMELVTGGTLLQRLAAGAVTPRFAMRLCAEVAAALAAAHAEGLVHRDIKPANIMLSPTGAKVVDFGIAAATAPAGSGSLDAEVLGTPAYLAPERLTGDAVEPASDVYALGVVLYRLLTGHSPWTDEDTTQMLTAHIYLAPAPLPELPGVPDYVADLCTRCLAKDPALRPSAREAASVLARGAGLRVVDDERAYEPPTAAAVDPQPSVLIRPAPARANRTPARRWAAAAAVLAVAGAGAGWLLWPDGSGQAGAEGRSAAPAAIVPARSSAARPAPAPASPATGTAGATGAVAPGTTAPVRAGAAPTGAVTTTGAPAPDAPAPGVPAPGGAGPGGPAPGGPAPGGPTPATPTAPATTAEPEPEPEPQERTFTSAGGTVRATCASPGTAEILSWTATSPYKVTSGDHGPGDRLTVAYKHGNSRVTVTVTCSGGVPSADVG